VYDVLANVGKVRADDATLQQSAHRHQFADVKLAADDQLRAFVSDSGKHFVYAVSSTRVSVLYSLHEAGIYSTHVGSLRKVKVKGSLHCFHYWNMEFT